ncbi:MAG: DUF5312 domain-containing protein [Spirochaetaceae bacterium]|jgi:hypothetical protein|nr:DUF5312 domain-containing protein [Spirochaetaceae bacterium]
MSGNGTFNRLALGLSLDERANLLDKLKGQSSISRDPLYEETAPVPSVDTEQQYTRLPWYYHLWYFILSFFYGKTPLRIYEDREVLKLSRIIEARSPGLYDGSRGLLLPEFYKELTKLKDGSRFFYTALDMSVNRDKGSFYGFLGSLEMGTTHARLSVETDPGRIVENKEGIAEAELRRTAFNLMEEIMAGITEEERTAMYTNARSLYCLTQLGSFLFDRIIMAFSPDASVSGMACSASVIWEPLSNLNNILFSLKEIPPMPLLESLFIFILQEHAGEAGFDINAEIRSLLTKAETSIVSIREFNRQVPLTLITRCGSRNLSLSPRAISGGEDWFTVYREYWRRHIEAQFNEYMRERRHREITNALQYFFKGAELKPLDSAASDSNPNGFPFRGTLGLSFLLTFYSAVFIPEINGFLRPILIDGEFYRRENRLEFTESYNEIIKLEDVIRKFDATISVTGDLGKRYFQARGEMSSLPIKRRKIQLATEEASEEAAEILERTTTALENMVNVLNGILKKDSGGKYETLINLAQIAGKGPVFLTGLAETAEKLQKAHQILKDIDVMEAGK